MINFNKFTNLGWQFKMPLTANNTNKCFDFKSNRMKDFRHYNSILQSEENNLMIRFVSFVSFYLSDIITELHNKKNKDRQKSIKYNIINSINDLNQLR